MDRTLLTSISLLPTLTYAAFTKSADGITVNMSNSRLIVAPNSTAVKLIRTPIKQHTTVGTDIMDNFVRWTRPKPPESTLTLAQQWKANFSR